MFDEVGDYSTHLFTRRAVEVIANHDTRQRLFLYLAYQAVHAPREVPEKYIAPYRDLLDEPRRTFAGMLSCLDEGVANVTAALRAAGMLNETLIWFTTDNGAPTTACGGAQGGQNYPLRGGKCSCWEGGLRGTAFVHYPMLPVSRQGTSTAAIMHAIDILPTLVSAAHGTSALGMLMESQDSLGLPLDGKDMWNVISTGVGEGPRTELLLEADPHSLPLQRQYCGDQHGQGPGTGYYALRRKQWKVILGDPAGGEGDGWFCTGAPCPWRGWNTTGHTNYSPLNASSVQLYDVVADPSEYHDRAAEQPAIVAQLLAAIKKYNDSAVPSYVCGAKGKFNINGTISPFAGMLD